MHVQTDCNDSWKNCRVARIGLPGLQKSENGTRITQRRTVETGGKIDMQNGQHKQGGLQNNVDILCTKAVQKLCLGVSKLEHDRRHDVKNVHVFLREDATEVEPPRVAQ